MILALGEGSWVTESFMPVIIAQCHCGDVYVDVYVDCFIRHESCSGI